MVVFVYWDQNINWELRTGEYFQRSAKSFHSRSPLSAGSGRSYHFPSSSKTEKGSKMRELEQGVTSRIHCTCLHYSRLPKTDLLQVVPQQYNVCRSHFPGTWRQRCLVQAELWRLDRTTEPLTAHEQRSAWCPFDIRGKNSTLRSCCASPFFNRHWPVAQLPLGRTGPFSIHFFPTLPILQTAPILYSSLHKYPEPLAFWKADLRCVLSSLGCLVNNPPCIANVSVSDFWLDAHGAKWTWFGNIKKIIPFPNSFLTAEYSNAWGDILKAAFSCTYQTEST